MRTVALLAVALLALAGCSSKPGPEPYTCQKTGRAIDLATVAGADAKGFDPESACPAPLPPSVAFSTLPAGLTAYFPGAAAWTVSPGNHTMGHSMLTQVRWSQRPIALEQLKKPDDYGTVLAQYAHQDVPGKFSAKLRFEAAGTYYLRAYAQVRGEGLPDADYWSPEAKLVVAPVNATGKTLEVTRAVGPAALGQGGKLTPAQASLALGDALVLANQDVVAHTFSFSGACKHVDVPVPAQASSDPVVMVVPGSCVVKSDDAAGAQQATLNVAEPA